MRRVVDASVAIKWIFDEEHAEAARRLQGQRNLFVPDFFFAEIGNVIWKRLRRNEITPQEASADYDDLSSYPWTVCPSREFIPKAIAIANHTGQAVYDGIYLALAIELDCQMVTADRALIASLSSEALQSYVLWVEDTPG